MDTDRQGYTIKQAAQRLGVSGKSVRRRIVAGELDAELLDSPHGKTYFLDAETIRLAADSRQVIQTALAVNRPTDATALALVIGEAIRARDDELRQSVDALTEQVADLTAKVEELTKPPTTWWQRIFGKGK